MSKVVAVPKSKIKQFLYFFPAIAFTILSEPSWFIFLTLIFIIFFILRLLISITLYFEPLRFFLISLKPEGTTLENKNFELKFFFKNLLRIFLKFLFSKSFFVSKITDLTIENLWSNKQILVEVFPISPTI